MVDFSFVEAARLVLFFAAGFDAAFSFVPELLLALVDREPLDPLPDDEPARPEPDFAVDPEPDPDLEPEPEPEAFPPARARALRRRDRLAQRLHEVDDLRALALLRLLAEGLGGVQRVALLELGVDELAELRLVVVLVLLRREVRLEARDELRRHGELLVGHLRLVVERGERGLAHLVGPQQRLEHEHVVPHAQRREPRALPERELHDRRPVGLLERAPHEHVRLVGLRVGLQVVAAVEQERVDLLARHELHDLDLTAALGGERGEVLARQHDGALAVVVRLVDVLVRHDLAVDLAHAPVADAAAVLVVDLVQRHVVVLRRGVHLDRHVDEAERDGALPDGPHPSMVASPAPAREGYGATSAPACGWSAAPWTGGGDEVRVRG